MSGAGSEAAQVEPIHDEGCESWGCAHCQVCGVGVLYGSRCNEHPTPGSSGAHARMSTPPTEAATS